MVKFLLYISEKYGYPILKPLQGEISSRGYLAFWFIEKKENWSILNSEENLLKTVDEVLRYDPDVIFVATNEVPHFFPGIKVQVFHGFSINKRSFEKGHFRIRGFFDLYCTQGPSTTNYFNQLKDKYRHFDIVETGWPKVDCLFPIENNQNKKPVILVASTFTKSLSLAHNNDVLKEIERLIMLDKWNWIITLHPKSEKRVVEKFKSLKGKFEFIELVKTLEPLKRADVLLADTTSVIVEFIIQKKPVVTINNNKPGNYLINVLDETEIESSIEYALSKPKDLMNNIEEFIKWIHPYKDGKSSKRIVDVSINFLDNNRAKYLKRKPLNIMRKFKIRKKLNYFKFKPKERVKSNPKILIIQQKMIGDVLVSSILCKNLKMSYPRAEIHYMVYDSTIPILEGNPYIDKIVVFSQKYRKSKRALIKFVYSIRNEHYDVVIDAYSKLESWITVMFSNASIKISYKKPWRNFLYSHTVERKKESKTNLGLAIENRLALLEPLNLNIYIDPVPKLFVTDKEQRFAISLFKKLGVKTNRPTVMIDVTGSKDLKTYPSEYMSKLVDFIADHYKVNILFNYSPVLKENAEKIYALCKLDTKKKIFFDVFGKSLREYIAIMDASDLIVGNDGGAINMAKALDKPSFTIFSPWIPKEEWATFEDRKRHISVHLKDIKPELIENKKIKVLKTNSLYLYKEFLPEYILDSLKLFIDRNLLKETT